MRTAIEKRILWQGLSLILLVLTIFSLPAFAGDLNPGAPPAPTMKTLDQIPPTWDQVLPASERFKLVMGGAAVLDRETGLVWEQSPSPSASSYFFARFDCNSLGIGGRNGWRLPTINELLSLRDPLISGTPKLPSGHPFSNVQTAYYWSDTINPVLPATVETGYFGTGAVQGGDDINTGSSYHWCVRGGQ